MSDLVDKAQNASKQLENTDEKTSELLAKLASRITRLEYGIHIFLHGSHTKVFLSRMLNVNDRHYYDLPNRHNSDAALISDMCKAYDDFAHEAGMPNHKIGFGIGVEGMRVVLEVIRENSSYLENIPKNKKTIDAITADIFNSVHPMPIRTWENFPESDWKDSWRDATMKAIKKHTGKKK